MIMKKLFYLFTLLLPFFLNSCDKQPSVMFTIDDTAAKNNHYTTRSGNIYGVGEPIRFHIKCSNVFEYTCDYGDGTTETLNNTYNQSDLYIEHEYSEPGEYTVRLVVFSKHGKKLETATVNLSVRESGDLTVYLSQSLGRFVFVYFLDKTGYPGVVPSGVPDCGDHRCANFPNSPKGTYELVATDNWQYGWRGEVTIEPGVCQKIHLTLSSKGEEANDDEDVIVLHGNPIE